VVIGPPDALDGLRDRLESGTDVQSFTDAEALEALEHVIRHKPRIIALDREFSGTSRGIAFVNRVKDDPSLADCDVRVIERGPSERQTPLAGLSATAPAHDLRALLDLTGTRRSPRIDIRDGVELTADGNPATLVNLSMTGAQIVSKTVLKPNQRVRLVFGDGPNSIRCNGSIAWAAFEMPKSAPPQYRAGVNFIVADGDALATFAEKHKKE
jgi:CheY-like chemotaxis protein